MTLKIGDLKVGQVYKCTKNVGAYRFILNAYFKVKSNDAKITYVYLKDNYTDINNKPTIELVNHEFENRNKDLITQEVNDFIKGE